MKQAVILAAGKGTRCAPLTLTRPKVLLPVGTTTILEHTLKQLQGVVDEVIIVVGYMQDVIRKTVGSRYGKLRIKYVEQKKQDGTGGALLLCKKQLRGRFILLNGDDIYFKQDIVQCLKHKYSALTFESEELARTGGVFEIDNGKIVGLEEKPAKPKSSTISTGCYVLNTEIFAYKLKKSPRGEYEATDYIRQLIKDGVSIYSVKTKRWVPVSYPWYMLTATQLLLKGMKRSIKGTVEKRTRLKGTLRLGKGSIVKSGAYIEGNVVIGDNCTIGPNCYIRGPAVIGNNCKIGNGVEVKNIILFDNSSIPHLSYVGDSIIGSNVNLGAGTITANLRFDHKHINIRIDNQKIDTKRKKMGAIVGDGAQTGINVNLMPGVRIWPDTQVSPGDSVRGDVGCEK